MKIQLINEAFRYDSVRAEVYDDFDIESSMEAAGTEDYVDMESVVTDSGRFFVDDDDPGIFEFDTEFDIGSETGFEDDEGLIEH